jgi:uncharacterized membrane protein
VVVVLGLLCAFLAKKKRKDPATWFNVGVVLSALAFLIVNEFKKRRRSS